MDWQQLVALAIVGTTAAVLLWTRLQPRIRRGKPGFHREIPCGCGCAAGDATPPKETIIFHARKGERPQVIVKMK